MTQATVVSAPVVKRGRLGVDHWFYIGVALFVILLAVVGFGPSIFDEARRNAPPTPLVILHATVASAWLLLFLTQATLVATGRTHVHRRLGLAGPVLALVMIVLGVIGSLETTRRTFDLSGDLVRAAGSPFTPAGFRCSHFSTSAYWSAPGCGFDIDRKSTSGSCCWQSFNPWQESRSVISPAI